MSASARSAMPMARMQWWIRPGPSRAWAIMKPSPSPASRLLAGTRTSVNRSSEWPCWSWYPNTGRCRMISRPGVSRGTRTIDCWRCGGAVGVGLAHDDEDLAALVGGTAGPPLAAVDHVVVAVADDRRLDVAGVGRGDVGLGHREAGPDLALEQRLEPPLLLLVGAEQHERLHVAGVRRPAVDRLGRDHRRPPGDLGDRRVLEVGEPGELVVEEVPQLALAGLGLQLLEHRGVLVVVVAAGGPPLLVHRLGGEHVLAHEVPHPAADVLGSGGEGEVHAWQRSRGRDRRRTGVRRCRSVRQVARGAGPSSGEAHHQHASSGEASTSSIASDAEGHGRGEQQADADDGHREQRSTPRPCPWRGVTGPLSSAARAGSSRSSSAPSSRRTGSSSIATPRGPGGRSSARCPPSVSVLPRPATSGRPPGRDGGRARSGPASVRVERRSAAVGDRGADRHQGDDQADERADRMCSTLSAALMLRKSQSSPTASRP